MCEVTSRMSKQMTAYSSNRFGSFFLCMSNLITQSVAAKSFAGVRLTLAVWAVLEVKDDHQRLVSKTQISFI